MADEDQEITADMIAAAIDRYESALAHQDDDGRRFALVECQRLMRHWPGTVFLRDGKGYRYKPEPGAEGAEPDGPLLVRYNLSNLGQRRTDRSEPA